MVEYVKKKSFVVTVVLVAIVLFNFGGSAQDSAGVGVKKKSKTESTRNRGSSVSFRIDAFPVIKKNCLPCHSEDEMNPSELFMDSYESIIAGGKHGKPVVPGKAKESLLIQKLGETPPFGDRMPLKAKLPLSGEEMKILTDWINQGAKKN